MSSLLFLVALLAAVSCNGRASPNRYLAKIANSGAAAVHMSSYWNATQAHPSVYVGPQEGLKEADKIKILPGQPDSIDFDHYAGYVTIDPKAGQALFYYFAAAVKDPASKPLILWLNGDTGGPGCSGMAGAFAGPGPFSVNSDGKTLSRNQYAWNKVANVIFLESPAGVGFSYSNTTSDYQKAGDTETALSSYTFLVNWLERFPQYKSRDLYIAADGYGGHSVPLLASIILRYNKQRNQTAINLQGIAIGNGLMDNEINLKGSYNYLWMHNLIPDEIHDAIMSNCDFSKPSSLCYTYLDIADTFAQDINRYDVFGPSCKSSPSNISVGGFDTCSYLYVNSYLNLPQVQQALHANVSTLPYPWARCTSVINDWKQWYPTLVPIMKKLLKSHLRFLIYSGDTDSLVPVTSTKAIIDELHIPMTTTSYPWYSQAKVGGYAIGYHKLAFVTVRGGGNSASSYQPAAAFTIFSSFIEGKLPPNHPHVEDNKY